MDNPITTGNVPQEEPQEQPKNKQKGWLIGCGATFLVGACVVTFLLIGGFASLVALFGGEPEGVAVSVSSPSSNIEVGEAFQIQVTISNTGSQNISVDTIGLPNELFANTLLTNITPPGLEGGVSSGQMDYRFDLTIAPTGQETIVFYFEALQAVEIDGSIEIAVDSQSVSNPLSLVISSVTAENGSPDVPGGEEMGDVIPYRSVVQIIAIVEMEGELFEGWTGSGTIISNDGLILTNAHVILSDRYYEVVDLVVAVTTAQDRPPQQMFFADVIQADANLDLAVIKVRSDLNGGPPNFADLAIEPVPLGDSNELQLGDEIVIIGYPGIGGQTITLTRGEVSGFTAEQPYGNRAYIKTSATIAGGNSGGLAATPAGEIIGVPTQVGSGDIDNLIVDCRPLADTNRDGVIDQGDNCVPTGGFINALRPIRLAMPLIEAARAGEVAIDGRSQPEQHAEFEPEGNVILSENFDSNDNDWALYEDEEGRISIASGQMVFEVNGERLIYWSTLPDRYDSLIMAAEPEILNSAGDGDFGFVCGYEDADNFTALEISEDGYYSIWKYENEDYVSLIDWTYADEIAADGDTTLAAYCGPDRLALAVNETLLAETVDPNYQSGRVGLVVGAWDNPNFRLGFENFYILQP